MDRPCITVVLCGILLSFLTSCNRSGGDERRTGFPFGVASGDVTSTSAVLWTRIDRDASLVLEIATSADFTGALAFQQTLRSTGATDFTAKIIAEPLLPGTLYFYRWRQGDDTSETGTFRTAPAENVAANVRFVYSGDMDGALLPDIPLLDEFENVFEVLDGMRRERADFFVFLGDTVYTDSPLRLEGPARSLAEYRDVYKDNRDIPALPNLLRTTSVYAVWDDHEVRNDFAGKAVDPSLYANGRQAFLEYMPIAEDNFPADASCAGAPLFRVVRWGTAVELFILDERSCRSANVQNVCKDDFAPTLPPAERLAIGESAQPPAGCLAALFDPARTMLGDVQKALFKDALRTSTATFKIVINEVPIQQLLALPYDRWEGYAAERAEILHFIRDQNIRNVIFLTTDLHANFINEVFVDQFSDPTPVAHEFVTGPIVVAATLEDELRLRLDGSRLNDFHTLLNLVGTDCRELDTFSYGVVEVNAAAGTARITLKDASGAIVKDQRQPTVLCQKTLGP